MQTFLNLKDIGNYVVLLLIFGGLQCIMAQPDISSGKIINNIWVYKDATMANVCYYAPGPLIIATDSDGKPDFLFLRTRYTGTWRGGDQGTSRFSSTIRFRVLMHQLDKTDMDKLRSELEDSLAIEIKPLPIRNLRAVAVYQALQNDENSQILQWEGEFSSPNERGYSSRASYWTEREFLIKLDNYSSQIFWQALQKDKVVLSVGYAFYADVVTSINHDYKIGGDPEWINAMQDLTITKDSSDVKVSTRLIKVDAFEIRINAEKWPDLLRQVDINSTVPPEYAALAVYCYDFNNELRPDLYAREIEIEAQSFSGDAVTVSAVFQKSQPDIYMHRIRFPFVVRLDKPYRYRVTDISFEKAPHSTEWIISPSWTSILDITSTCAIPSKKEELMDH